MYKKMLSIIGGRAKIIDMRKKSCLYVGLRKFKELAFDKSMIWRDGFGKPLPLNRMASFGIRRCKSRLENQGLCRSNSQRIESEYLNNLSGYVPGWNVGSG
jgi:hypothetical protein